MNRYIRFLNYLDTTRTLSRLTFLFFLIVFCSCEDVVQVELDEGSKLYVIDAFLQTGFDGQWIQITTSSPYSSNEKPEPIINAHVKLRDLTTKALYTFYHSREGVYQVFADKDSFAVVNHQYELEVEIDGTVYKAMSTQPRPAKIDSISAEYTPGNTVFGQSVNPFYTCNVWAKDKADDNPDYYWIKTPKYSATNSDITLCIDGTQGVVKNSGSDSIYFSSPFRHLNFQTYSPGSFCAVEIHAISRDTYDFLRQAREQIQNGGMFAKTPENIKTNFVTPQGAKVKAVGWFSMASVVRASKDLP